MKCGANPWSVRVVVIGTTWVPRLTLGANVANVSARVDGVSVARSTGANVVNVSELVLGTTCVPD